MTINLKLLSAFALVAEYSSFRRAAEEIGRSQSAVSLQIRHLEEQLGVTLFHRTTRKVMLSSEGEKLLAFVRHGLSEINLGVESIFAEAQQRTKRLSFACTPTIASARLADMLTAFKHDSPDALVHVTELAAGEMLDSIQAQDVEFGIGPRVKRETDFHFSPIMRDEILAVMPVDHAIDGMRSISLRTLSEQPIIMILKSSALRAELERLMDEQHVMLNSQYEGMHLQTMLSLVEAGLGVGILPKIAVPASGDLRFIALPLRPPMYRELCVVTLVGKTVSPLAMRFIAVAQRVLRGSPSVFPSRAKREVSKVRGRDATGLPVHSVRQARRRPAKDNCG